MCDIKFNEVKRYNFLVKVELYDNISKEQINKIAEAITNCTNNINNIISEQTLWKSKVNYVGSQIVKRK